MRNLYFLLFGLILVTSVNAQVINFPDANFKTKLLNASPSNFVAKNLSNVYFKIDANNNGEIEVSEAQQVSYLYLVGGATPVVSFDGILNFINLKSFTSDYNTSPTIDLGGLLLLQNIDCTGSHVTSINVNGCSGLKYLTCPLNSISSLDLTGLTNLLILDCHGQDVVMTSLNLSTCPNLQYVKCYNVDLASLNVTGCTSLISLECNNNLLTSLDVSNFTNLVTLNCSFNPTMNTLNVSGCNSLQDFKCGHNQLVNLNVSNLSNLITFDCSGNQISTLNFTGCSSLVTAYFNNNQLTTLDLTPLTHIQTLYCGFNPLTTLHLAGSTTLKKLVTENCLLSSLDFTNLIALRELNVIHNNLTTLNIGMCSSMYQVLCAENNLMTTIFAKTGNNNTYLNFVSNPSLRYICVDDSMVNMVQVAIENPECHVNTYCSFSPGGTFYTMQGKARLDYNNNGCDVNDFNFPYLKLTFSNATQTSNYIPDSSGNYHYDVQSGTYTLVPILDNPSYFNVSPTTANVTFPTTASPFIQDFCITPNGSHPDLEITILPITTARPGFDTTYKIIYRNKDNQTESGTIDLTFDDAILDFVSSVPATSNQTLNHLNWNFTNLQPLAFGEIIVTLNLNSPMESPPVFAGMILNFTASINGSLTDETPENNTATLHQTVINSFDPNDKTCLEGNTITPEMVGKEVHYMIRFENTGTANAENIVVKDMIDMGKFDINSLIPIDGSHPFVTKISNTNKVEFIFENINLPFDDANNDGYVAFKIKTKPTLVVGDSFSNTASIYFDYNFPIITNTATTIVALLANQDFEFADYFKIYPNPAAAILNIETKQTIEVTSVNIYNTLEQLVLVIPNAQQTKSIDVSSLKTGNYFMKINSDKGSSSVKFVKM